MINPLAIAACLALGFGGLAFAFVGGDSRADKRRAAVTKTDAKASVAASVDRATRKKQIADGVRDSEMRGKRKRVSLATKIEQAGLSNHQTAILDRERPPWPDLRRLDLCPVEKFDTHASCRRHGHGRVAATHAGAPAHSAHQSSSPSFRPQSISSFAASNPAFPLAIRSDTRPAPAREVGVSESSSALDRDDLVGRHRADTSGSIAETNFFDVIAIQSKAGGNLSEALGNLFACCANAKDEGKDHRHVVERSFAAIIGACRSRRGALYVSSPKYISLLWTTSHGKMIP